MLITTCCGWESHIAYDLCPDCHEHCDWEIIDEDEIEEDRKMDAQIEQNFINQNETT